MFLLVLLVIGSLDYPIMWQPDLSSPTIAVFTQPFLDSSGSFVCLAQAVGLSYIGSCVWGELQTMFHIVGDCMQTKLNKDLNPRDSLSQSFLRSFGMWCTQ